MKLLCSPPAVLLQICRLKSLILSNNIPADISVWWCCRWSACDRLGSLWSPDKALLIDMLIGCVSWFLYDQRRMRSHEAINFHDCAETPWTKECNVSLCARSHAWFDGSDGGTGGKHLALCLTFCHLVLRRKPSDSLCAENSWSLGLLVRPCWRVRRNVTASHEVQHWRTPSNRLPNVLWALWESLK